MGLVKQGARVAVIERYQNVGGGCTHWGTIPSKALRHAVSRIIEFNQNPLYSDHSRLLRSSFADILNHADNVINQQTRMRQGFYERNHCEILQGNARFVDEHTLALDCPDGSVETLTAEKFVIACGSRPYHPTDVDFTHPRIYDSDSILSMHHEPRHVLIYGAGVIGCEYASIFRGMDVKVDLINTRDRLLAFLDQEMSDSLSYHFWNSGVVIRHNEEYEKIEGCDDGVIMHLKSGKKLKADCLLYANGRTGNTDSLALQNIGLETDSRGQLKVNSMYQTAQPHVYAVGDVIGYPSLASDTVISAGGGQSLQGQAVNTTLNGGEQWVHEGGIATVTVINEKGWQAVKSGAVATDTVVNTGAEGGPDAENGDTGQFVRGNAVRTTINKNGRQIVAVEGTANTTVVYAGGDQTVHGHALDTTLNGGYQYVHNGFPGR